MEVIKTFEFNRILEGWGLSFILNNEYFLLELIWIQFVINFKTKDRFGYCKREIEEGIKCKKQCDHCEIYYKPLEDNLKKIKK